MNVCVICSKVQRKLLPRLDYYSVSIYTLIHIFLSEFRFESFKINQNGNAKKRDCQ